MRLLESAPRYSATLKKRHCTTVYSTSCPGQHGNSELRATLYVVVGRPTQRWDPPVLPSAQNGSSRSCVARKPRKRRGVVIVPK